MVALAYPVLILTVIMVRLGVAANSSKHFLMALPCPSFAILQATANHYLLDAVGGFFVTILAYKLNTYLLWLRPIEEWGFWLCRTERPLDKAIFDQALRDHGHVTAGVSDTDDDVNVHLLDEERDGRNRMSDEQ